MVAADLDDEIAFLLRRTPEVAPIVERTPADTRSVEHRARRQRSRINHPRRRDQRPQQFQRGTAQRLRPIVLQPVMVEQRETELLLLEGPHRWRNGDLAGPPRFENKFLGADVPKVEEFKEPIENINFLRVSVGVVEQRVLERKNILRPQTKDPLAQQLQLVRQPLHFRPVGPRLVAHDECNEWIQHTGPQRRQRCVKTPNHRVAGAEDRSGHAPVGIQPIQKGRQPNATRHGVQFSEHETFIRQQ